MNDMNSEILDDPAKLQAAMSRQYERVARAYAELLGNKERVIAEIGCGRGQLTIPLAKIAPNLRFILIDKFAGLGYSRSYNALVSNLKKAKLVKRARIVRSDYKKWIAEQQSETYDSIISSEFLAEIGPVETSRFIHECHRVLKPRGITVHSDLSPIPRNSRQGLLIMADSHPSWTRTMPNVWFAPKPHFVVYELRKSGFHRIRRSRIKSRLILKGDIGRHLLINTKASFFERHAKQLDKSGLELPDWLIISGVKP